MKENKLEDLTIKEAKEKIEEYKALSELFGKKKEEINLSEHPYPIGKNVFIRTGYDLSRSGSLEC